MAWDFASNRPSPRGVDLTQQAEGFFTPDGRCISIAFTPGYLGLAPDDERDGCTIRRVKISPGEIVKGNAGVQACATEQECTQEPWCRINGKCQRAAGVTACGTGTPKASTGATSWPINETQTGTANAGVDVPHGAKP
jgi:hypothetical protein